MRWMRLIVVGSLLLTLTQCLNSDKPRLPVDVNLYRFPEVVDSPYFVLLKDTPYVYDFSLGEWCFIRAQNNEVYGFVSCDEIGATQTEGILSGLTVVLDAGHGGAETGASYFGVDEKDVNLAVTNEVRVLLEAAGANVVMTRKDDETVRLYTRPSYANLLGLLFLYPNMSNEERELYEPIILHLQEIVVGNSSYIPSLYEKHPEERSIHPELATTMDALLPVDEVIFVSIHSNSTKDQALGLQGTELIISDNRLANQYPGYNQFNEMQRLALRDALQSSFQKAEILPWHRSYSGNYAVLRESNLTSILIELGYLNHEKENEKLQNPEIQKELAQVIVDGIVAWYSK